MEDCNLLWGAKKNWRINRITSRRMNNNCLVVAPWAWARLLLYRLATFIPSYQGGDGSLPWLC